MSSILISPGDVHSDYAKKCARLGARLITWPELNVDGPENYFALDEAIENLFGYDWLILKNERAASYFLQRFELKHEAAALDDLKILAVGDRTTQALAHSHVHVDVPVDRSETVMTALSAYTAGTDGLNILVPSANVSRDTFEHQLEDAGARVDNVSAYRTTSDRQQLAQISALLVGGGIDAILFTRPQSVSEFATLVDSDDLRRVLGGIATACVDEETSATAGRFGLVEPVMTSDPGPNGLANLINAIDSNLSA